MKSQIWGTHRTRAATMLIAALGLGIAASAQAAGLAPQPMRPHAAVRAAPAAHGPTLHHFPAHMHVVWHMSCVTYDYPGDWLYTDRVRLKNVGSTAIPPGTTVYWYMPDHRQWSLHRLAAGLPPGRWVMDKMPGIASGGKPCKVVFHKLAWMGLHAPRPGQAMQLGPRHLAPGVHLATQPAQPARPTRPTKLAGRHLHLPYHLTCKFKGGLDIGALMTSGTALEGWTAIFTNHGPGSVPAGTELWFAINGKQLKYNETTGSSWEILSVPLAPGKQISVSMPDTGALPQTPTCTAYAK